MLQQGVISQQEVLKVISRYFTIEEKSIVYFTFGRLDVVNVLLSTSAFGRSVVT